MRNLDIADSRAKLEQFVVIGMIGTPHRPRSAGGLGRAVSRAAEGADAIACP